MAVEVGIRIIRDSGLVTKWLGETLGALSILHTGSVWILRTTESMDHVLHHQLIELRISVRIRNLSR